MTNAVQTETAQVTTAVQTTTNEKFERHVENSIRSLRKSNEAQSKTINRLLAMVEQLQERLDNASEWAKLTQRQLKLIQNERIADGNADQLMPAEEALIGY